MRYADDFLIGFQLKSDADRFHAELCERLRKFALELHPDKTRLIRFGRFAAKDRAERGERKPEPFDFLSFTHICGKTRSGEFLLKRRTMAKRMRAKLHEIRLKLLHRRHRPVPEQGAWLAAVVRGYFAYHAVPTNADRLSAFLRSSAPGIARYGVGASGIGRTGSGWRHSLVDGFPVPASSIYGLRSALTLGPEAGAQCVSSARWDLCGGRPESLRAKGRPYRDLSYNLRVIG